MQAQPVQVHAYLREQQKAASAMLAALIDVRFWVNETGHYLQGRNPEAAKRALACVRMLTAAIDAAKAAGIKAEGDQ